MIEERMVTSMIEELDKNSNIDDIISAVNEIIEHLNSVPPIIYQINAENIPREHAQKFVERFKKVIEENSPSLKFIVNVTKGDAGFITSSDLFTARIKNLTVEDCERIIEGFQERKEKLESGDLI